MKCRYCNATLAPLRSLIDGEFCCDEHRSSFREEQLSTAPARSAEAVTPVVESPAGIEAEFSTAEAELSSPSSDENPSYELPSSDYLLPLQFESSAAHATDGEPVRFAEHLGSPIAPRLPHADLKPVVDAPVTEPVAYAEPVQVLEPEPPVEFEAAEEPVQAPTSSLLKPVRGLAMFWHWPATAWRTAPLDLKAITVLLPVLLSVAFGPSVPKAHVAGAATANAMQALDDRWKGVKQNISQRAAIAVTDDFRSGLDAWDSRSNLTSSWSYDAAGFVRPGPLAILKTTTDLTDYHFEFLGEIDRKGMGSVFRARDLDNYYALKFTEAKAGPLPVVKIVRYTVINGKEVSRVEKPLPLTVRADMLYRVMVDAHGNDFTIMVQGQVVDFFSDSRLRRGGIGFFCDRGEKARLRWVEVSHQYDALGRLCAYLAPYGLDAGN
ncbi:MAG: hypothetical protein LAP38_07220 [Acidobacteriia bacterium]|nr:hypothetical protein [Terriglobia bacterium]